MNIQLTNAQTPIAKTAPRCLRGTFFAPFEVFLGFAVWRLGFLERLTVFAPKAAFTNL